MRRQLGKFSAAVAGTLVIVAAGVSMSSSHPSRSTGSDPEVLRGVPYASVSPKETLDLWLPQHDDESKTPLVILIHPGAFKGGSSTDEDGHATALVSQGFAVASLNYRLSRTAKFPAAAQDVKAAVRWLRAHAATYRLDPDRFAVWGQSAGGWLSSMIGLTGDQSTMFDDPTLGNADQSSQVQAVVTWFGLSDFTTIEKQAEASGCSAFKRHNAATSFESRWLGAPLDKSPHTRDTDLTTYAATAGSLPPFFLTAGDADCVVPDEQSRELADALRRDGDAEVILRILPGFIHGDPLFDTVQLTPTIDFLKKSLDVS